VRGLPWETSESGCSSPSSSKFSFRYDSKPKLSNLVPFGFQVLDLFPDPFPDPFPDLIPETDPETEQEMDQETRSVFDF
jgi:hypothetical protein